MNKLNRDADREYVLKTIKDKVLHYSTAEQPNYTPSGIISAWTLDFRVGFSHPQFLKAIARLFWEQFDPDHPWQIGGLESASLPLVTALALTGNNVQSFYIRKSRKKKSLLKQIEGDIDPERDIILVDDLINSGSSFIKQIKVLENERGLKVKAIFSIMRFRDPEVYKEITDQGIEIKYLFDLPDIGLTMNDHKVYRPKPADTLWEFVAGKAHFLRQGQKNIPLLHRNGVLHMTDDGVIYRLDQTTGQEQWRRKVMFKPKGSVKTFVGSLIHNDLLYVTTYRGALIVLDAVTGTPQYQLPIEHVLTTRPVWCNHKLIMGVNRGQGWDTFAVVAVDLKTQEIETITETKRAPIGTILVDEKRDQVVVADVSNSVYCVSSNGEKRWDREFTGSNAAGVGTNAFGDVVVITGAGETIVLHAETGKTLDSFTLPEFHATPPTVSGYLFYGATLGREVYCYNYQTHEYLWRYEANGRMYSAPSLTESAVVVGDNNGRVYTLDKNTGKLLAHAIMPERVTNPILVTTKYTLISTFANELYMMKILPSEAQPVTHDPNHQSTDHDSTHRDETHP